MSDGIYVALSGAIAAESQVETTATNLANVQTTGYERLRPVFREALAKAGGGARAEAPRTTVRGDGRPRFAGLAESSLDPARGEVEATDRALDVALPEKTFLAVATPGGERYTRAGALTVKPDGTLATAHGDPIVGENGKPLAVGAGGETALTIGKDGVVSRDGTTLGRLRLVGFAAPQSLVPEGGTLLRAGAASGTATATTGVLAVGALESSNVPVALAMTDLVQSSRIFDAFQRSIEAFRDADRKAAGIAGGGG